MSPLWLDQSSPSHDLRIPLAMATPQCPGSPSHRTNPAPALPMPTAVVSRPCSCSLPGAPGPSFSNFFSPSVCSGTYIHLRRNCGRWQGNQGPGAGKSGEWPAFDPMEPRQSRALLSKARPHSCPRAPGWGTWPALPLTVLLAGWLQIASCVPGCLLWAGPVSRLGVTKPAPPHSLGGPEMPPPTVPMCSGGRMAFMMRSRCQCLEMPISSWRPVPSRLWMP